MLVVKVSCSTRISGCCWLAAKLYQATRFGSALDGARVMSLTTSATLRAPFQSFRSWMALTRPPLPAAGASATLLDQL